jgi:hypothetical protein
MRVPAARRVPRLRSRSEICEMGPSAAVARTSATGASARLTASRLTAQTARAPIALRDSAASVIARSFHARPGADPRLHRGQHATGSLGETA